MIADAWYMVTEYHLRLGPLGITDNLEEAVKYIHENYGFISSEKREKILEGDQAMKKDLEQQIYFEDMEIGDKVVSVGRTITEADIVSFAGLTGDYNTLHTDAEFAKGSIAGQRLAHGMLPLTYSSGLFTRTSYNQAMMAQMAALTEINWKFKKPVLIGDTIHVEQEVIEKADPRPESDMGKVTFLRTIFNQRGEIVQQGEFKQLIRKYPK